MIGQLVIVASLEVKGSHRDSGSRGETLLSAAFECVAPWRPHAVPMLVASCARSPTALSPLAAEPQWHCARVARWKVLAMYRRSGCFVRWRLRSQRDSQNRPKSLSFAVGRQSQRDRRRPGIGQGHCCRGWTIQALCFVAACGNRSSCPPWPLSKARTGVVLTFVVGDGRRVRSCGCRCVVVCYEMRKGATMGPTEEPGDIPYAHSYCETGPSLLHSVP